VEGSSNNKALEFCNPSSAAINLVTESYVIQLYNNNSTSPTSTITLTGTVLSGGSFVLAHSSAVSAILSIANQTSSSLSFNGDDVVVLRKGGATGMIVDSIGRIGSQPNVLADITLQKKSCDLRDTNTNDVFDRTIFYNSFAVDTFTNLKICPTSCSLLTSVPTIAPTSGAPLQLTSVPTVALPPDPTMLPTVPPTLAPTSPLIDGIVSHGLISAHILSETH
jgi:predicted extracellular nuclease